MGKQKSSGWLDKYSYNSNIDPFGASVIKRDETAIPRQRLLTPEENKRVAETRKRKAAEEAAKNRPQLSADNISPEQRAQARKARERQEYINNSQLAQSLGAMSTTPGMGAIAAQTITEMNPAMSIARMVQTAKDPANNPYGISSDAGAFQNTLGTLGLVGDVFDFGNMLSPAAKMAGNYLDQAIYPTRTYRASVPGGNPPLYESSALAEKVAGKGDWTTKDLSEAAQYLGGLEVRGGRPGLLTGQNMNLTEYKVPFWKKSIASDPDVIALKKLQDDIPSPNEYIIPNNKFLYPRRTNLIQAVPENVKESTFTTPLGDQARLYNPSTIPLSAASSEYISPAYKYIEDQINAVTGHQMPLTHTFEQAVAEQIPMFSWKQPQFAPNEGIGKFERFGNSQGVDQSNRLTRSGFNPLALLDQFTPRLDPIKAMGVEMDIMDLSPLNLIPGYGKNLSGKNQTFRKFGNSLDDVIQRQALSPAGGSDIFRMGKNQIVSEGNWAAINRPSENYPGVFEATFDMNNPNANLSALNIPNRTGVLMADRQGRSLPEIPLTEPGMSFNRRLPFSTRYVPIDKTKLMNNEFQLATQLPYFQSLAEKYGLAVGGAGAYGYLRGGEEGAKEKIDFVNKYTVDPVLNLFKDGNDMKSLPQKKNGGWLEKYNDGGKIQENYNDYSVSAGPGFQGDGYSNEGRNYSPAWGGQFEDGGELSNTDDGNWLNKLISGIVYPYGGFGSSESEYKIDNSTKIQLGQQFKDKKITFDQYKEKVAQAAHNKEGRKLSETWNRNMSMPNVDPANINASYDALYMHQGLPQKYNSFIKSQYKPSTSKDQNSIYYSLSPSLEKEILEDLTLYQNKDFIKSAEKTRMVKGSLVGQGALKNFKYSKGKDDKGDYISYYDVNDYGNILDLTGKPFEIYNRIYLDPKTGQPKMAMGGSLPGATGHFYARYENGGVIPTAQGGINVPATRSDSVNVYNNAKAVQDYYKTKGYKKLDTSKDTELWKQLANDHLKQIENIKKNKGFTKKQKELRIKQYKEDVEEYTKKAEANNPKNYLGALADSKKAFEEDPYSPAVIEFGGGYKDKEGIFHASKPPLEEYYKPIDENTFNQREQSYGFLDLRSPMPLYDKRITPQGYSHYVSPKSLGNVDNVQMYEYDPLATMPWDMIPIEQQQERIQKYGTAGAPADILKKNPSWTTPNVSTPIATPSTSQSVIDWMEGNDYAQDFVPEVVPEIISQQSNTALGVPPSQPSKQKYTYTYGKPLFKGGPQTDYYTPIDENGNAVNTPEFKTRDYAMGGSMPGSVGFTYARTQSPAPSNGKYAKKTKASAQNGTEMKYYQEGLDFKPKSISRNGGQLTKLDQLTNFTNYNTKQPGGWLDKYK
jgi:hypothetical protein